jgi:tRNA modification GTPase
MSQETIFALSTLAGKSGVAMVRISGPESLKVLAELGDLEKIDPRVAHFVELKDPNSKEIIDQAIALYFKAPKSFTGEDVVELQFHGSIAVIEHILEVLSQMTYIRMAQAGEFARRAFINNKMDLTQAEALADLIDSETRVQKRVALRQLGGQLRDLYESWRTQMIEMLAKLEALIDFPEDDIPQDLLGQIDAGIKNLVSDINKHLGDDHKGELIRRGMQVAIVGEPNVGKSSLMNLIAKNDVAIVSDIAGTTRDVISVKIDLHGYPVMLHDTAGLRESDDVIESEGVKRAQRILADCDMQIMVLDSNEEVLPQILLRGLSVEKPTFALINKSDLGVNPKLIEELNKISGSFVRGFHVIEISVKKGYAVTEFLKVLGEEIKNNYSISDEPLITRFRYRENLLKCVELLQRFEQTELLEVSSEYVRQASFEIGRITGRIDVEEILDKIFSSFCIGK